MLGLHGYDLNPASEEVKMQTNSLTSLSCEPCRGNTPPFTEEQIAAYTPLVSPDWVVVNNVKLVRPFTHQNFLRSLLFVNAIAFLAEKEGHHPDLIINYNQVTVEITTHAIHGLSRNDFIIAAKVDDLIRYK